MLSIIIPTLNEEKYLPRLLDSIESQDFLDYEIIVSDAGSTDSTPQIANERGAHYILSKEIKHPSYQRNQGVKKAKGEILLFLDADSMLSKGFLSKAISTFSKKDLIGAGFYIKFNPNHYHYNLYSCVSNIIFFLKQYTKNPVAIGAGIMSKKEAHQKIKGFDLEVVLAEDYDYCSRLAKEGKFRIINHARLYYSSRRIEKEGFFRAGWKWLKMGFFTLRNKKIKKKIVKYDFGKF
jgi:glycosyltransferase involved in cell wall biosynthesis